MQRIRVKDVAVGTLVGGGNHDGGGCFGLRGYGILSRKIFQLFRRGMGESVVALEFRQVENEVWDGVPLCVG